MVKTIRPLTPAPAPVSPVAPAPVAAAPAVKTRAGSWSVVTPAPAGVSAPRGHVSVTLAALSGLAQPADFTAIFSAVKASGLYLSSQADFSGLVSGDLAILVRRGLVSGTGVSARAPRAAKVAAPALTPAEEIAAITARLAELKKTVKAEKAATETPAPAETKTA